MKQLIISMFHSVPGVPRAKMERLPQAGRLAAAAKYQHRF